uniref:Uncharacterized protein n=1 Tax=Ralstonia solanacearum TaxID=305 RepID=A0A0S4UDL5_RALSL|nr:protein of unknown function [Ralstonia solanacearum]CUV27356.1 protein of unknown function [Ralstonia solanacearum]CUV46075.1 protein of unknown function [Ralstonia solanacearum]CUV57341.1 protein of unknown function [Ralstonia solanacearum]
MRVHNQKVGLTTGKSLSNHARLQTRIAPHFSAVTLASWDGSRNTDSAKRIQNRPASAGQL